MGKRGNVVIAAEPAGRGRPDVAGRDLLVVRHGTTAEWGLCVGQSAESVTVRWPSGSETQHPWTDVQQVA